MTDNSVEATCHCGAVRFAVDAAPEQVTDCNCSICRRYGTLWAYYTRHQVWFLAGEGATDVYVWGDRSLAFHRCRSCGCVTHWAPISADSDRIGVNARLMPPAALAQTRIQRLDKADTPKKILEGEHPIWWAAKG